MKDSNISHLNYLHVLQNWVKSAFKDVYSFPDRPDLECYGTGYNNWGVQTNQKALAALAVLGADPNFDSKKSKISQEQILDHTLKMLRFSLQSHIEGNYHCTDGTTRRGTNWGHAWISALGIERMMHGIEAIEKHLTEDDRILLKKVILSECDWLLDNYDVLAGPVENNRPESNIWNGAILFRASMMYPDAPRTKEYSDKGTKFLVNSISVPSDANSKLYVGNNFFDSYACNHHRYLNVGYMVICLSNVAMLHFAYKKRNIKAPEILYNHVKDLWKLVKMCIFPDGRLIRIGGDTRVRYCYCQDYVIPMWLMMNDYFGDKDCVNFEIGWLKQIEKEIKYNKDDSFLSKRCKELAEVSPLYYTRLESDRAVTLSMGAFWRKVFNIPSGIPRKTNLICGSWQDEYHGASMTRGSNRVASFVWRSAEPPQGLCLPVKESHMAEWKENTCGEVIGTGTANFQEVISHNKAGFEGGFITWGKTVFNSKGMIGEGQGDEKVAIQNLVFAVLPDDATVVVMQQAKTTDRVNYIKSIKGLSLKIPNDLFNGNKRIYYFSKGKAKIKGFDSKEKVVNTGSLWLNVDDKLSVIGVYGGKSLQIYRPGRRQIGIKNKPDAGGMLYVDEICYPCSIGLKHYDAGAVLYDIGFIIQSNVNSKQTKEYVLSGKCYIPESISGSKEIRVMIVCGKDNKYYLLVANFGTNSEKIELKLHKGEKILNLVTKEASNLISGKILYNIKGGTAEVLCVE